MLFNCNKCKTLTIDYINKASGLDLHRFKWLSNDDEIGSIKGKGWNQLLCSNEKEYSSETIEESKLVHWTLGGPWFKDQRDMGGAISLEWFCAREQAMRLWE